jgi:hypothetical protein
MSETNPFVYAMFCNPVNPFAATKRVMLMQHHLLANVLQLSEG